MPKTPYSNLTGSATVTQRIKQNINHLKHMANVLPTVDSIHVLHDELSSAYNVALDTNKLFEFFQHPPLHSPESYVLPQDQLGELEKKLYKDYHGALRHLDSVVVKTTKMLQQHNDSQATPVNPQCLHSSKTSNTTYSKALAQTISSFSNKTFFSIKSLTKCLSALPYEKKATTDTIPLLLINDDPTHFHPNLDNAQDNEKGLRGTLNAWMIKIKQVAMPSVVPSAYVPHPSFTSCTHPPYDDQLTHDYHALQDKPLVNHPDDLEGMLCIQNDIKEIRTLYDQVAYQMTHQAHDFDLLETEVEHAKHTATSISHHLNATKLLRRSFWNPALFIPCVLLLVLIIWFMY